MPVQPTSAARQRRCSGRGVSNHPRPTPEPPSLDRGYGPAGRLRWPWACHPAGGGGAGWRGARTAKCTLCRERAAERDQEYGDDMGGAGSLCRERAAQFLCKDRSKQAAPSPVPQRQRRRKETQRSTPSVCASFITDYRPCAQACVIYYFPPAHPLFVVAAAAAQQCSAIRSGGIGGDWGAGGGRAAARLHRRPLSRAHAGAARAGAELSRGAGALPPAVRSGHWRLSSPPRQPGSSGAAAVGWVIQPRPTPASPAPVRQQHTSRGRQ